MRVSQRLDYTLRALVDMAGEDGEAPVSAGEIAARLGLPKRFLEQQLTAMGRQGLVVCRRGSGGGCVLSRPASEITVAEVVRAVQGEVLDVPRTRGSAVAAMWSEAAETLATTLGGVTLAELAERQVALDSEAAGMYYL